MTATLDLNADLGESFGTWVLGDDLTADVLYQLGALEGEPVLFLADHPVTGAIRWWRC